MRSIGDSVKTAPLQSRLVQKATTYAQASATGPI